MQQRRKWTAVRAVDGYGAAMRKALPVASDIPSTMKALLAELERRLSDDDHRRSLDLIAAGEKRGG